MQNIQNLTNRPIEFQGVKIGAYCTASFVTITDYVSLSRLLNSGKVRSYTVTTVAKTTAPEVKEEKKAETKQEKKVEVKVEPVVETKEEEVIIPKVDEEEGIGHDAVEDVEKSEDTVEEKKTSRRKSSKK